MPLGRSDRWRVVDRRAFEEASGIVLVRPRRRDEDKGDNASALEHRSPCVPWINFQQSSVRKARERRDARHLLTGRSIGA